MISKMIITSLLALSTVSAFAETVKNARANDVASKYILADSGTFSRVIRASGLKCDITTNVADFKVSGHKNDVAMVYFKRKGDLFILRNISGDKDRCPKADKKVLVAGIRKYTVVSNASEETKIVNLTLDNAGNFRAWDNNRAVVNVAGIKDFVNNECFGKQGASFSSYTAFGIKYDGRVVKVKGRSANAVVDNVYYTSLSEFKASNNVCR